MSRAKRSRAGKVVTYPIGQRVRILGVLNKDLQFLVGRTGTVVSTPEPVKQGRRSWIGQDVSVDDLGASFRVGNEIIDYCPSADLLQPIDDYDGQKAGSWDTCCWKPAHVLANM